MASVGLRVEGAEELRRAFRRAKEKGLQNELKAANKSAAEVVVRRALPNVPVRTGRLRSSVKALGSQRDGRVKAGTARVDYAAAIHWGRKQGNVGSPPGNRMGVNPVNGRPFLYNAAQDALNEVTAEYQSRVQALLERTLSGA